MEASAQTVSAPLLAWYHTHARALPWRSPPGSPPPEAYRVWLSEVMLQQTTTTAAAPYFMRFIRKWPDVHALAAAQDGDVMAAWAGLGYYARARNLLACARAVVAGGGTFPDSQHALRSLPGLGDYTSAAVAAIAFGRCAVVIDANVERVVARLFAIADPLPGSKRMIRAAADAITPQENCGDFAQGMMDLGAQICTPRAPQCALCPLAAVCAGFRQGNPQAYPVKKPRAVRPERRGRAFWIERNGMVWLVRRAVGGMLGGMRALPDDAWTARADGCAPPPLAGDWRDGGRVSHVFSHFALTLGLALYSGCEWASLEGDEGEWWPLDRIEQAGLPSLFAKAARQALALGWPEKRRGTGE